MKVYLDDIRHLPDSTWTLAKTEAEAISLLENNDVSVISLDHDLGEPETEKGTGYGVLLWIEQKVRQNNYYPPKMLLHTANPIAAERMDAAIRSINLYLHNNNKL
jgi:hypothetical protein